MQFDLRLCRAGWGVIDARHFNPLLFGTLLFPLRPGGGERAGERWGAFLHFRYVRIFRFGRRDDAEREICEHALMPFDFLSLIIAPNDACQHTPAWHGDTFCMAPRREAIELPALNRKSFLPPAVQSLALICADGERTVARFASGFPLFKLRSNLIALRNSRPSV